MRVSKDQNVPLTNAVEILLKAGRADWVLSYPLDGYKNYRHFSAFIEGSERQRETFGLSPVQSEPFIETPDDAAAALENWGDGNVLANYAVLRPHVRQ